MDRTPSFTFEHKLAQLINIFCLPIAHSEESNLQYQKEEVQSLHYPAWIEKRKYKKTSRKLPMKNLVSSRFSLLLLTVIGFAKAAQASPAINAKMSCKSEHLSISINEEYSFQDGYYVLGGSASLNGQPFQDLVDVKTNLKVGQPFVATIFSAAVNGDTFVLKIPQRTYLSFEKDRVKGKVTFGEKSETAVCTSGPL